MCVLSTMTREWFGNGSVYSRLILGSNLSRLCLASLICLCMLTVGVGNAWGEEIYRNNGETVTSGKGATNSGTTAGISDKNGKPAPSCTKDPTIGTAQLKGSVSQSET